MQTDKISNKEIKAAHPIDQFFTKHGFTLVKQGSGLACKCPLHDDKSPSLRISTVEQAWYCDPCGTGGSVVDFWMKWKNVSLAEAMKHFTEGMVAQPKPPPAKKVAIAQYSYKDAGGKEVYQSLRYMPKTFAQRHMVDGKWVWTMDGIERVLYNLPEVLSSDTVWIVEGEKDADTLNSLGLVATCNVAGAGKWLDPYAESLLDKKIYLCPDQDTSGLAHAETVMKSLAGKVKSINVVTVPPPCKDISEHLFRFATEQDKIKELSRLGNRARVLHRGVDLPLQSMDEMRADLQKFADQPESMSWDIATVFPSFYGHMEALVPGDLVVVMAATGIGKTAILQNMAVKAGPRPVVFFQQELAKRHTVARFMQIANNMTYSQVLQAHREGKHVSTKGLEHIFVCSHSGITTEQLKKYIEMSDLKLGEKPLIVFVDYLGLMQGKGDRYERVSNIVEELRAMANNLGIILVVACQLHRKPGDSKNEVGLYDAKDSGSIENSASLTLGAWRDTEEAGKMYIRALKVSNGSTGITATCRFNGATMQIHDTAINVPKKPVPTAYKDQELPDAELPMASDEAAPF